MAKAGRKRNPALKRRKNNASAKPSNPDKESVQGPTKWNRLKEAVARNMEDPRWGTELGRLHYQGRLLALQREAGERFLVIVTDHRKYGIVVDDELVVQLPKAQPKVSQMERMSPGSKGDNVDVARTRRAQDNYDKVFIGVVDSSRQGVAMWRAVMKLCVDSEVLTFSEEMLAKKALDRLTVILGLTGVR